MKTTAMEKITVKKLKEILAQFPDEEAVVRIEDHYIGYGLNSMHLPSTSFAKCILFTSLFIFIFLCTVKIF